MKMLEQYYVFNPTDLVNIVDEYNPLEDYKTKEKVYAIKTNACGKRNDLRERKF